MYAANTFSLKPSVKCKIISDRILETVIKLSTSKNRFNKKKCQPLTVTNLSSYLLSRQSKLQIEIAFI